VVADVALDVGMSDDYIRVPVTRWIELAREHARVPADGYFLSCTNTTQIEAIEPIERKLGKPVVNSNQAVLWACVKRLCQKLGAVELSPALGRLVRGN
jgi:maleate isomerase